MQPPDVKVPQAWKDAEPVAAQELPHDFEALQRQLRLFLEVVLREQAAELRAQLRQDLRDELCMWSSGLESQAIPSVPCSTPPQLFRTTSSKARALDVPRLIPKLAFREPVERRTSSSSDGCEVECTPTGKEIAHSFTEASSMLDFAHEWTDHHPRSHAVTRARQYHDESASVLDPFGDVNARIPSDKSVRSFRTGATSIFPVRHHVTTIPSLLIPSSRRAATITLDVKERGLLYRAWFHCVPCEAMQQRLVRFVTSGACDFVATLMLVANAITIGAQVDFMARHVTEDLPPPYRWAEVAFCVVFSAEILLRIFVCGSWYLSGRGWRWNVFDIVVVSLQIFEQAISALSNDSLLGNISVLRVLRVLRLMRVVRFVRFLRLIHELRAMVSSVVSSLRTFLWTLVLLFLFIFIFSVYTTQVVVSNGRADMEAYVANPLLARYYGSLGLTILSLGQAISGGVDWNELVKPLANDWSFGFVFTLYIAFATLVMLNLVTGIFVESAQMSIRDDKEIDLVNRVHELFISSDENRSGSITWQEFQKQLGSPQMEEYFKVVDLDVSEAKALFNLIDIRGTGEIQVDDFVQGCIGLCGAAKAKDLKMQMFNSRRMFMAWHTTLNNIQDQISQLMDKSVEATATGASDFRKRVSNDDSVEIVSPRN